MSARERTPIPAPLRRAVIDRDRGRCRYCGIVPDRRRPLHLDHVRPVFLGGLSDYDNLVVACGTCNGAKSSRTDVVQMPLPDLVAIAEGHAPERPPVRRMRRSRDLDRGELRAKAGTGQRIGQRAEQQLIDSYPRGTAARCDHCGAKITVGITGQLRPALATLACTSCARTPKTRRGPSTGSTSPGRRSLVSTSPPRPATQPPAAPARGAAASAAGVLAKFAGTCAVCHDRYTAGGLIRRWGLSWAHPDCHEFALNQGRIAAGVTYRAHKPSTWHRGKSPGSGPNPT